MLSHPLQRALLPDPDVTDDQNTEEDQHLQQSEQSKELELYRPRKEKDGLHVEDNEQDGDNVVANGVASAGPVDWINTAFVRKQFLPLRIVRPNQLRQQKCNWNEGSDDRNENEDGDVVLRQWLPRATLLSRSENREDE